MKTNLHIAIFLIGSLFWSCQNDDRSLVVGKIQSVAKLSTTQFTIDKLVHGTKTKKIAWFIKLNEARFLAYSKAYVKTGVDLKNLMKEDIEISDNGMSITLRLPAIEVISFSYPSEEFRMDPRISDPNRFLNSISIEDQEQFFREAEIDIRNSLKHMGIVETSQEKTRLLFNGLLRNLGYEEIHIHFKSDELVVREVLTEQDI